MDVVFVNGDGEKQLNNIITVCRHKLEEGNCATDGYVERKVSHLVRENEDLKAALEEEQKRRDPAREHKDCPSCAF